MTPEELAADLKARGFPPEELDRVAREGTFEELDALNHATGFLWPSLRQAFERQYRAQRKAAEVARAKR